VGLALLALTGGFALGEIQLGQTNLVQQGSQTSTIGPVAGLVLEAQVVVALSGGSMPLSACPRSSPCNVTGSNVTTCAGELPGLPPCQDDSWFEQTSLSTQASDPFCGTVELAVSVTSNGTLASGTPRYFTDARGNSPQTLQLEFGIGNASAPEPVSATSLAVNVAC